MSPPSLVLAVEILLLLMLANGTPVIAKKLLGSRWAYPIDGGRNFFDGRPLFGASKTIRGFVFSVVITMVGAGLMGYAMLMGALFAAVSLTGDLVSSFIKRRFGMPSSSRAHGLDQIPESILPLLVFWQALGLNFLTAALVVVVFYLGENILSRLLFRMNIRERPY